MQKGLEFLHFLQTAIARINLLYLLLIMIPYRRDITSDDMFKILCMI